MKLWLIAASLSVALSCEQKTVDSGDCVAKANPTCNCTQQYDPVCGCNGVTYGNACQAACAGIRVVSQGGCTGK